MPIQKKEKSLKKIQNEILPDDERELLFYDEAFFRREGTVTRAWYPRGERCEIDYPVTFEKIGVCAAVNPTDGRLLSLIFDGFDSDTFLYYLRWLLRTYKPGKKIVLVLDNASSHTSRKVAEFAHKRRRRLQLLYLPPYSPDLNPAERIWKNLRYRVTHNVYFDNLKTLEHAVMQYLKEHSQPNKQLASLCCNN